LTHPYPGAFTHLAGRKVLVWKAAPAEAAGPALRPGEMTVVDGALIAGTGEGLLRLESVQADGEEEVPGAEFAARHVAGARAFFTAAPTGVSA
jgi:methionyl-tRNA formyltransferase